MRGAVSDRAAWVSYLAALSDYFDSASAFAPGPPPQPPPALGELPADMAEQAASAWARSRELEATINRRALEVRERIAALPRASIMHDWA